MDSLTQITLGAAVGEVVLGKKAGNRAMVWGAVAGTIPDLDIMANFFMDEISALAAHRGFSHSLLFACIAPPFLGWLVHRFYQGKLDRNPIFKIVISSFGVLFALLLLTQVVFRPIFKGDTPSLTGVLIVTIIAAWLFRRIWVYNKHQLSHLGTDPSWKDWSLLFFWGIFTHPLLDCFTTYGTQIFQPFSDYRVSFNTISVADPVYTTPFLLCLIIASYLLRGSKKRAIFNWLGIGLSSAYLIFSVFNKMNFNGHFENSLAQKNIQYSRYMSTPTILNQILWVGIAESDRYYYYGTRSWFDRRKFIKIDSLYKGHQLLDPYENEWQIDVLKWFSDGYFNVMETPNDETVFNDIRFGVIGNLETPPDTTSSPFQFYMSRDGDQFNIEQRRDWDRDMGNEFGKLYQRIMGVR